MRKRENRSPARRKSEKNDKNTKTRNHKASKTTVLDALLGDT